NALNLTLTHPGGFLNVAEADVFSNITARADNMTFTKVVSMNPSTDAGDIARQINGLHFDITGWGTPAGQTTINNMANTVNINVTPCSYCTTTPAVVFDRYIVGTGTVNANTEWLETVHTIVGNSGFFATPWETMNVINNKTAQQNGQTLYTDFY